MWPKAIRITSSEDLFLILENHQYHAILITTALQLRQNCKMRKSIKGCNRKKISAVLHQLKLGSIIVPNVSVFWEKLKEKGKKESHGCKLDFFQSQKKLWSVRGTSTGGKNAENATRIFVPNFIFYELIRSGINSLRIFATLAASKP